MKTIGFIGAGNMAFALAGAIDNHSNDSIAIYDINSQRVDFFTNTFKRVKVLDSIKELLEESDIIVLAVKPQIIDSIISDLKECDKIIVSIAAGINLRYLSTRMAKAGVARVMPNTPSLVGQMAAGVSFSSNITTTQKSAVLEFLSYSGLAIEVDELYMDAVTGISGSGPAFVGIIMESFIKAGVSNGLSKETAKALTFQTFLGTARLLIEKKMDIEELITMVSSPGGTTIAGREVLESSDMELIIKKTVARTVARSKELGEKC